MEKSYQWVLLETIKNSRYLVKSETFCQQTYSCHALLFWFIIQKKAIRLIYFLRAKIPFWASVQIPQSQARIHERWNGWIFTPLFLSHLLSFFFLSLKYWLVLIHYYKNSAPISNSWIRAWIYLSLMMLLNYRFSLLFTSGHIDCYPLFQWAL